MWDPRAVGIFFFLFPLNLIQVQGYSATAAGAAILPLIALMFVLSSWSGGLVARYGARGPMMIGPLIAAAGFALFAIPSTGNSYWVTFFPPVIVLGFGLALTVAPLTTVVMNAVDQDRAGAASGVNNAVARLAGVLAIAVFGIVMFKAFDLYLSRALNNISLPGQVLRELHANEIKLAGLAVPEGLDPDITSTVKKSIAESFVFGFRIVMLCCAGLSLASVVVAWRMIPRALRASQVKLQDE